MNERYHQAMKRKEHLADELIRYSLLADTLSRDVQRSPTQFNAEALIATMATLHQVSAMILAFDVIARDNRVTN